MVIRVGNVYLFREREVVRVVDGGLEEGIYDCVWRTRLFKVGYRSTGK